MTELTIEVDGELERALEAVAERARAGDGETVTREDVAEQAVREYVAQAYRDLLIGGG